LITAPDQTPIRIPPPHGALSHNRAEGLGGKDFWSRAILLTSKDANLTKAHVRYLESRFIALAAEAGRVKLTNGTAPPTIALPEADQSDMEYFIDQAKIVLPVLGVNILRSVRTSASDVERHAGIARTDSPVFQMTLKRAGITARAMVVDGEFTVLEGSHSRKSWIGTVDHAYMKLIDQLVEDGTLAATADASALVFTRNCAFSSPSAAAATISGRTSNGRTDWVVQGTKESYGQWESEGVEEAMLP
jgi:hypothetical protein